EWRVENIRVGAQLFDSANAESIGGEKTETLTATRTFLRRDLGDRGGLAASGRPDEDLCTGVFPIGRGQGCQSRRNRVAKTRRGSAGPCSGGNRMRDFGGDGFVETCCGETSGQFRDRTWRRLILRSPAKAGRHAKAGSPVCVSVSRLFQSCGRRFTLDG